MQESLQARTSQITALSDAQLTSFDGSHDHAPWGLNAFSL